MPKQKQPTESNRDAPVERREQPRGDVGATDWETIVLKRVERHVESLSGDASSCVDAPNQSGGRKLRSSHFGAEFAISRPSRPVVVPPRC